MPVRNLLLTKTIKLFGNGQTKKNSTRVCARYKHYDVVIAGGGLVGTAMACAIAKNPILSEKSVVLFDAFSKKDIPKKLADEAYSNRVFSLNPGTRKFFESLGVWKYITDTRFKPVKKMQVWDACSDAIIVFNEDLVNDVSYIIENDVVLYALESALKEAKNNVQIVYDTKINHIKLPHGENKVIKLATAKGEEVTCSLLIGADGANSQTRQALGGQYLKWNYDQIGIVATLKLAESIENIVAWQRFLPSGPIALLPLTDELSSLVWSISTNEGKQLMQLSDESFVDAVNDAFWKMCPPDRAVQGASEMVAKALDFLTLSSGAVRQLPPNVIGILPKSRASFPLGFGHSTEYVAPGVALIGDAAHRVHPLAGQGVNLGFGDVKCLSDVLADGVYSGYHIGSLQVLKRYQSQRLKYNFPIMMAIDGLHKLFGTTFSPVVALRTVGLQMTNALHPLKSVIMKYASGS